MNAKEPVAPVDVNVARREYVWLKWATVFAIALGCAIPLSLNLVDPDLWGHVQYGQDWLAEGTLPRTASHTFTAVDYPWINHENLAELAFATGYRVLGTRGLLIAKCLWGMAILLAMVWVAQRNKVHAFAVWPLMLLIAANLQAFFPLRPQLLSFALCAITLVMLDRAFCDWQTSKRIHWQMLWALPIVFVVWVNAHGGFALGLCIVGAYLGGRIFEALLHWRTGTWPRVLALSVLGLSCVVATLANPYGWELHRWLAMSLGQARPEITEWAPPKMGDPLFWQWIGLLAVTATSLFATRLRRDWVQIAILAVVAWQSALHLRHIAFLALLCGFWLPVHFQSALSRLRPSKETELPVMTLSPWLRRLAVSALLLAIGLQSFALRRQFDEFPVERNRYPVDALQFMADRDLTGKLVVSFNWAQYAIAALAPDVQVAFDGRFRTCYPQEVVDMHFDFLLGEFGGKRSRSADSGPIDGTRVLEYGSPDLVLVDRRYEHPVAIMKAEAMRDHPEWVLLYCDRVAELWGHRDRYDNPTTAEYLPLTARVLDASPREGSVQWPALPIRTRRGSQLAEQFPSLPTDAIDMEL
ncbi:MAG: hypothetical protein GXP24_03465 [Planctomycetes bacterium]|nr:hypothetical protein [Planctomycetota bacterium]